MLGEFGSQSMEFQNWHGSLHTSRSVASTYSAKCFHYKSIDVSGLFQCKIRVQANTYYTRCPDILYWKTAAKEQYCI
jgi:hypothetical protein